MDDVRKIADAVLYEGYLLWPYTRSALKNQRRWTFGGVYPPAHGAEHPDDRSALRTQCLVEGDGEVEVVARFLHVVRRQVLVDGVPVDEAETSAHPPTRVLTWDEAVEREAGPGPLVVPEAVECERVDGHVTIERSWRALRGRVTVTAEEVRDGVRRVTVEVANETPFAGSREDALRQTFCSTHVVLRGGPFVSLTDPPEALAADAAACVHEGLWPVLVGSPHTMLAAPIILEDYPRVAPESPGDLFDGGEVDELLVLNILGLTDEEKAEMRASDPRARAILERTEGLTDEQLLRLHGARR